MKRHIKALIVVLLAALLASVIFIPSAGAKAAAKKVFSDVDLSPSSDGYKAIYWAVDKGITTGIKNTDKFGPEDPCTRAQAVTFIWRLAGKPEPKSSESPFTDIDAKYKNAHADMYKAILWASGKKIVAGYSDNTFRPDTKCSRAHIVTFLYRYAGKPDQKKYSSKESPFTDVKPSIGKDMYPAILWAKVKGITTGISGTKKFSPNGICTRKQIVTFLWRYAGKKAQTPVSPTPKPNAKDTTPYKKITLDGVKDHHFIADDYCYIESEKYILFLEKHIDVPGDLKVNLDAIVDEVEAQLGLSHNAKGFVSDFGNYNLYGTNNEPWLDWDVGAKIPILLMLDKENSGYISHAFEQYVKIYDKAFISEDYWNSSPYYKDKSRDSYDYVDYENFSHEITHAISLRYCQYTDILAEGIAQYAGINTLYELADDYPSIQEVIDRRSFDGGTGPVPEKVNASNAERIFIEEYNPDVCDEHYYIYRYGYAICDFLKNEYGDKYFSKLVDKIIEKKLDYSYGNYSEAKTRKYAAAIKEAFGDDVFTKFGNWCVANHMLQSKVYIPQPA